MNIKEFFSLKKNRFFWVNIAGMILAVFLLAFAILKALDTYTRHGQAIIVPDAKGMGVFQAEALFRKHGLNSIVFDSIYVKEKSTGSVLDHIPASGQKVKAGRIIYLTVNTLSVPLQLVPDVADNSSLRQAQARMLSLGFKLTAHEYMRGETDWVYKVKYNGRVLESGEKVPVGATLTLVVGDGMGEINAADSLLTDPNGSVAETATDESWF